MKIDFSGKNVLVTGSSGGIGRAICIAFSELNARVHLHYNSNKEYITNIQKAHNTASYLIRQIDDVFGRSKLESLKDTFEIKEISDVKYGVIWNIKVNSGNFDSTLDSILETNILFNPLSYECYRIR